ncbi:MAG: hypothetical protein M1826_002265 [Phylliscum demangeonii]|nr:MAG: hypothetical protein M1826_002265 [Phylliscum demangeonii]
MPHSSTTNHSKSQTGISYQNPEASVTLIDIPTSITYAQGESLYTRKNILLSREPLEAPIPVLNEPLLGPSSQMIGDDEYHTAIAELVKLAIEEIQAAHSSSWCLPRKWIDPSQQDLPQKRKAADGGEDLGARGAAVNKQGRRRHGGEDAKLDAAGYSMKKALDMDPSAPYLIPQGIVKLHTVADIRQTVYTNPTDKTSLLCIRENGLSGSSTFHVPGQSTFMQAQIEPSVTAFKLATLQLLTPRSSSEMAGQFDFLLLDPPWPNASVRRARSYQRQRTIHDAAQLLLSTQLEDHMAPDSYVGIWITNKARIREMLLPPPACCHLGPSAQNDSSQHKRASPPPPPAAPSFNLFDRWGLELVEEWVWIKTTTQGEPITSLSSTWKKPYEIMLLGRKKPRRTSDADNDDATPPPSSSSSSSSVKRRVIAAVPDLHSRKPSLKSLIEPLMPAQNYRALEIFARNLTDGWWAWGDEVLKFNADHAWTSRTCDGGPG